MELLRFWYFVANVVAVLHGLSFLLFYCACRPNSKAESHLLPTRTSREQFQNLSLGLWSKLSQLSARRCVVEINFLFRRVVHDRNLFVPDSVSTALTNVGPMLYL